MAATLSRCSRLAPTAGPTQLAAPQISPARSDMAPLARPTTVGARMPAITHPHRRRGTSSSATNPTPAGGQNPATVSEGSPRHTTERPSTTHATPTTAAIRHPGAAAISAAGTTRRGRARPAPSGVVGCSIRQVGLLSIGLPASITSGAPARWPAVGPPGTDTAAA